MLQTLLYLNNWIYHFIITTVVDRDVQGVHGEGVRGEEVRGEEVRNGVGRDGAAHGMEGRGEAGAGDRSMAHNNTKRSVPYWNLL